MNINEEDEENEFIWERWGKLSIYEKYENKWEIWGIMSKDEDDII